MSDIDENQEENDQGITRQLRSKTKHLKSVAISTVSTNPIVLAGNSKNDKPIESVSNVVIDKTKNNGDQTSSCNFDKDNNKNIELNFDDKKKLYSEVVITNKSVTIETENKVKINNRTRGKSGVINSNNKKVEMGDLNVDHFLKIVSSYDGTPSELHKFFSQCSAIYDVLTEQDDKDLFFKLVKTKLVKRAYDVVKYNDFKNWPALQEELKKQFEIKQSVEHLQIELVNARQNHNENVQAFAFRIEQILSNLNDACIAREGNASAVYVRNLNSSTALRSFENGLRISQIQLVIKASRFTTLKEAIDKAIEEETNFDSRQATSNNSQNVLKCQLCNKRGHSANKCFSLTKYKNNSQKPAQNISNNNIQPNLNTSSNSHNNNNNNGNKNRSKLFCNFCRNQGHIYDNCFKRLKKNNSNSRVFENSNLNVNGNSQNITENTNPLDQNEMSAITRVGNI